WHGAARARRTAGFAQPAGGERGYRTRRTEIPVLGEFLRPRHVLAVVRRESRTDVPGPEASLRPEREIAGPVRQVRSSEVMRHGGEPSLLDSTLLPVGVVGATAARQGGVPIG